MTAGLDLSRDAGLLRSARLLGECAGRHGSTADANPFDADSPTGQAWEEARAKTIEARRSADLFASIETDRRARR